jgi:hypothetical protein
MKQYQGFLHCSEVLYSSYALLVTHGGLKTMMDLFTIRLPIEAIGEVERQARQVHIPPRTLVRAWVMQRLDQEGEKEADEKRT